jgi:hypothetical protein
MPRARTLQVTEMLDNGVDLVPAVNGTEDKYVEKLYKHWIKEGKPSNYTLRYELNKSSGKMKII